MTEALKAVTLISVSLGAWTALSLLLARRGDARLRRTVALFVALLLLPPLRVYLDLAQPGWAAPALLILSHSLSWTFGPLLWRCAGLALLWPPGRWQHPLHFLPFALAALGALAGWDWAASPALVSLVLLQVLGYAGLTLRAAWQARAHLRRLARGHRNSGLYWLIYLAAGLLLASGVDLATWLALLAGQLPAQGLLLGVALVLALYVDAVALLALHQPAWLDPPEAQEAPAEPAPKPAPPRAVELSPTLAQALRERLQALVQAEAPHCDPEISLPRLAERMDITPHQLSELLNVHMGCTFYEFLNDCRHRDALQLLAQQAGGLTVADIAYRAGFNNRNSFYKVFKERTGQTPAEYRRQQARRA
ncbi:helix-turn-helix transcriptional regulator [Inhella proteolytica]|uniref:Helix-turn-helix transcriptional regulator n=1 Tax=Inhella proteolytica TaxID=2795029 RepID=A0A931NGR9_9BURK|nr:helix-turn-helix transcriptional regulator [Inhella proteolytica]MBH9576993.1 helix-turn-helix transcriptional regulator [Inhella proteolytica]